MPVMKKNKVRLDDIARDLQREMKVDASEATTIARELLKVRTQAFQVQYAEFMAVGLVPRNTDVDDTDEAYTYQTWDQFGRAELMADYSTTAPKAEAKLDEATPQKIKPIVASYEYSFMEARRSAKLGKELPMRKALAARRAIAQEVDRVVSFGDTTKTGVTLPGLLTLSGTETYTTPTGAAGSKAWTSKTPDEIVEDLLAPPHQVNVNSKGIEECDSCLLPLSRFRLIERKRMGDGSDTTILNYVRQLRPNINYVPWYNLESAPASEWTGKRMMHFRRSAEKLELLLNPEFEQLAPDVTALSTKVVCHARIGGVVLYLPKSVIYSDEI